MKNLPKFKMVKLVEGEFTRSEIGEFSYKLLHGKRLVMLGELEQMPGHCMVVDETGGILWGYHTHLFTPMTEDEV